MDSILRMEMDSSELTRQRRSRTMYANIVAQKQEFNNGNTIHIHYQKGGSDYRTISHLSLGSIFTTHVPESDPDPEPVFEPEPVSEPEPIPEFKVDPDPDPSAIVTIGGTITTLAGNGSRAYLDGTGTNAAFHSPTDLTLDSCGTLYVADSLNYCIRTITPNGEVATLVGSGIAGYADGIGSVAEFDRPESLAITTTGIVYIIDTNNSKIRKIEEGLVTTFAGDTNGFADGQGTSAGFNFPGGITVDTAGILYVADAKNHRIRRITPDGTVSTLAGSTKGYFDGPSNEALFSYPSGIAVDTAGLLYIADKGNHRIRTLSASGIVSTLAGGGFQFGVALADRHGTNAIFSSPSSIAIDCSFGILYVSDTGNNCIRTITSDGDVQTLTGSFNCPHGIAIDPTGTILYVADTLNNCIQLVR